MILVDTSIWIEHLRGRCRPLEQLLDSGVVHGHPSVLGELALGRLSQRSEILNLLRGLPQATVASDGEVLDFVEHNALYGLGIGYVDAQLLAATRLTPATRLWTADKRLAAAASGLDLLVDQAALDSVP